LLREVGGEWPVVLQEDTELAALYQVDGSPMAYVVDEHGATGSERASGASAVLELARSDRGPAASRNQPPQLNTRPLTRSHLNRDGLPAGTPAPAFRLPSLAGGEVALEEYRGSPLLLLFSDPTCEPCDRLAPELERVHQRLPRLQVLMISRGDVDANRAKVAQHGLTFPVVLQHHWEVSRAYGMFATPMGYLIDERGVIAADVAVGADAIRALMSAWDSKIAGAGRTREVMR
jgi:peroxiredoxin